MHTRLIEEATKIQSEGAHSSVTKQDPDDQFKSGLHSLQSYVLALCPKAPLVWGIVTSLCLSASSFALPFLTGRLYDSAIAAASSDSKGN